jgi:hypothetical protein
MSLAVLGVLIRSWDELMLLVVVVVVVIVAALVRGAFKRRPR